MADNKIKFIVIGCGHIGKRHAQMILDNPTTELVALIDVKDKSELNTEGFEVPFFNNIDAFFASEISCDVANIAVPNGLHASVAITMLKAGMHVVIEKPMTLKSVDAAAIIETAQLMGKEVFVVMQNRYSPPSQWLKSLVDSGKLGDIYMVQINCFWNRDERYYTPESWHGTLDLDGGTLYTQFSHFVDIMYWLFGDIKKVESVFRDFNHSELSEFEDSGMVNFEFVNGGIGNFNFSTSVWDSNLESSMTIIAQNGSVKVGGQYMDKVEYCHIKDYKMPELAPTLPGNDYGVYKGSAANHQFVIQNVVDVLQNNGEISTKAEEGKAVVAMIEQMYNK